MIPADTTPADAGRHPAQIVTFGCRLNAHESDRMARMAAVAGVTGTVIVNSCAVTAEAERQARQAIRRARRLNPDARIIATGCAAALRPQQFAAMPEVDAVIGNRRKLAGDVWAGFGDPHNAAARAPVPRPRRARAYVAVQNGCDHRCTFCTIPFGRGPSRSVPTRQVIDETAARVAEGHAEVVLTGVDLTSWGRDLPGRPAFGALVAAVLDGVPALPRLRLSSIDAAELDPLLEALVVGEPRLMPHLHLSLQAGDDMILKRMKRRHGRAQAIRLCQRLAAGRPLALGADLIAGFPTETRAMFENTLRMVDECGLSYLHVFPFSPRPGTPAARMPQLPRDIVRERARLLRAAGDRRLRARLDGLVGSVQPVLVESAERGRTACYAPVRFARPRAPEEVGRIVTLRAVSRTGLELQA